MSPSHDNQASMLYAPTLPSAEAAPFTGKIRVAALVNLFWHANAGGHVKCWERLAEAACAFADHLDLTVHFSGDADRRHDLADNVRFKLWRPVFSTAWLPFLNVVPDHTDIALYHPRLARDLAGRDVIHTTDAFFAFANTARRVADATGIPLVHSTHTDTPRYTRIFTARVIERLFGGGPLGRLLTERAGVPDRMQRAMERKLERYRRQAALVMVSSAAERAEAGRVVANDRVFDLGRGIDFDMFTPAKADRPRLEARFGVPRGRFLVAFAGRLNCGKNVRLLMRALDRDWMARNDAHLFLAGDGEDRQPLARHFGPFATCPGIISQPDLATVYASADAFVFPSMVEVSSNVLREALASGTCVLAASEADVSREVIDGVTGLHLPGDDPAAWRQALAALAGRPAGADAMGSAARAWARRSLRAWPEVLRRDLLPVWRRAAAQRHAN